MYKTTAHEEFVISGNDALMKCNIPSFMSDFVSVTSWVSSEGLEIHSGSSTGNNLSECLNFMLVIRLSIFLYFSDTTEV